MKAGASLERHDPYLFDQLLQPSPEFPSGYEAVAYRMDDGSYYFPGEEEVFEQRRQTIVSATITGKTLKMTVYGHGYTGLPGRQAILITNFIGRRQ